MSASLMIMPFAMILRRCVGRKLRVGSVDRKLRERLIVDCFPTVDCGVKEDLRPNPSKRV